MMKDLEFLEHVIDQKSQMILDANDRIWEYAELAYHETRSADLLCQILKDEGFSVTTGDAGIPTCFTGTFSYGSGKPVMGILGEYDALSSLSQKAASPRKEPVEAGAPGHGCGHSALGTGSLAAVLAVKEYLVENKKDGTIIYFGCPAEEGAGSKQFMARAGMFDNVDFVYTWHPATINAVECNHSNAIMGANFEFKGVSSHAGGSPEAGKNALYAATCGLNAVNAIRETFVDGEHIRFHPIITEGGAAVNAIPETAKVESYVRGASFDSIRDYNKKVNLALAGAAASLGCNVELDDHPGYFPLNNDTNMTEILTEAMEAVTGPGTVTRGAWGTGCTDMGDVSAIMPAIHPHASGSIGTGHGKDYYVADKKAGCLYPAQCLTVAASMLLENDAARAKKVLAEAKPYFKSKEEYLAAIDNLTMDKDAVIYNEDGTVTLDFCQR